MNDEPIKICILGGGFGGLYTALYLCIGEWSFAPNWVKSGKCEVTLVEPKDNFLFSPLLYEILTGELQRWEIAPSYQKLLAGGKIRFCQDAVESVNLKTRQVDLLSGDCASAQPSDRLSYDYLVLAVGNQSWFPDIPGLKEYALTFRSLADADRLEERLRIMEASERQRLRIAVIGGGANGVELACKLCDRLQGRVNILLIERGNEILSPFSKGVKKAANKAIKKRSIDVYLETDVKEIEADKIVLNRGENITLPVDLVLWTAGTESIAWVKNLDCQQTSRGKLLTRPTLQLIDYPEVFALGDLADIRSSKTKSVPMTAQAAYQQASCVAKNIKATLEGKSLKRFRYLHLGDMLTLGKGVAVVSSYGLNLEGFLGGVVRSLVYIQRLPTWRHRLQVLKNLVCRWTRINADK
jgi:NADH:ubiquinone reductase (non-electrogenic)